MSRQLTEIAVDQAGDEIWREPFDRQRPASPGDTVTRPDGRFRILSMTLQGQTVCTRVERDIGRKKGVS